MSKPLPQFDRTAPYKGPMSLDLMLVKWKAQLLTGELPKAGSFHADLARLNHRRLLPALSTRHLDRDAGVPCAAR